MYGTCKRLRKLVWGSFGLNCRTEVQELTLKGWGREAKKRLRPETRRKHKFTRIRNTTARVFLVVTGQSLGDKGLGFHGLLAEITRDYLWPYHGDR